MGATVMELRHGREIMEIRLPLSHGYVEAP